MLTGLDEGCGTEVPFVSPVEGGDGVSALQLPCGCRGD